MIDAIESGLRLLIGPSATFEIRGLAVDRTRGFDSTLSGYFTDAAVAARAVAKRDSSDVTGWYVTLNPIDPSLRARRADRIEKAGKDSTTKDQHITRRTRLLVDFDAARASGISSSDAEHDAALAVASEAASELAARGWPEPMYCDSGNGAHLDYAIDLPADDGGLVERVLKAMHHRFGCTVDGVKIKVDTANANPARITKLYGSRARKGDNVPDRPHRMSRILRAPEQLEIVTHEQLEAFVVEYAPPAEQPKTEQPKTERPKSESRRSESDIPKLDFVEWAGRFGLAIKSSSPYEGKGSGTLHELTVCPFNADHGERGEARVIQFSNGALSAGCFHDGCKTADWGWKWLREKYDPKESRQSRRRTNGPSIATVLVDLAGRESELWQSTDGEAYATLTINGHREHVRIGSGAHRQWMARLGWQQLKSAVGDSPIRSACMTLAGLAMHDGERHPVHVRIAGNGDQILVDLCDSDWRAIEIDAKGWRVVNSPAVRFTRRKAMSSLPSPVAGGSLDDLREHVKITDESWPLVVGWLVGAMSPQGPYPALVFRGQHGAGKSHSARVLRSLVDPSIAPIRSEPREPRDLVITAKSSHVTAYDNISSIPPWLSDGLCRLATGGGYAARTLFTDEDETVIDVVRPVILTGITDVVTAPDLLDRCLLVELDAISTVDRRTERTLNANWAKAQPRVLGALCSAVSKALERQDTVMIAELPRLADWATWATAAEPALGITDGAVIGALNEQVEEATEIALEASIIARPIRELLQNKPMQTWKGTAGDLLSELNRSVDVAVSRDKSWPKTPRGLAGALARIQPALRTVGVAVERMKPGELERGQRGWRLTVAKGAE